MNNLPLVGWFLWSRSKDNVYNIVHQVWSKNIKKLSGKPNPCNGNAKSTFLNGFLQFCNKKANTLKFNFIFILFIYRSFRHSGKKQFNMTIDFYYLPGSSPCRSVLMTAKAIGVALNMKITNLKAGEHLTPEFVKVSYKIL